MVDTLGGIALPLVELILRNAKPLFNFFGRQNFHLFPPNNLDYLQNGHQIIAISC